MSKRLRPRLSYANVVSTLCLFALLGGGAYAATKLKKDTVGSKQLKAKSVKSAELADGAVIQTKLADGAVTSQKLADGGVTSAKIASASVDAGKLAPGTLSPSCPAGTTRFGTVVCVDTAARAAGDWFAGMNTCAAAGLRLPTTGEIWLARSVAEGEQVWTDLGYRESSANPDVNVAMAFQSESNRIRIHGATASLSIHCATLPGTG